MEQLILHLWGDFILQSDWMANYKAMRLWPCLAHTAIYSLPFLFLAQYAPAPGWAWFTIWASHFLIDHFRLARYLIWLRNWMGPSSFWRMTEEDGCREWMGIQPTPPWRFCTITGCPPNTPQWLAVWLFIIADNTLHLTINYIALRWL
jgi:Protein of unknown function (DUF3307)